LQRQRRERLRAALEALYRTAPYGAHLAADPIELPRRYRDPRDVEVSGLLAACLAYGRADLFKPRVAGLLGRMGRSPAAYVAELDVRGAAKLLEGFVYRFNLPTDVAVLLLGMGGALRAHGSLEAVFAGALDGSGSLRAALVGFGRALRDVPRAELRRRLGPERGLDHLLPAKEGTGAAKRLNLYLRWMVRGPDPVDFGIWRAVSPADLIIPLDTHIARMSRHLGLTRRRDLGWRTAEEITAALREIDPADPVRFDFALCHFGMSGRCPLSPSAADCAGCLLREVCADGRRRASVGAR
jgi:uncharacterized protein (TIGR02757 family)